MLSTIKKLWRPEHAPTGFSEEVECCNKRSENSCKGYTSNTENESCLYLCPSGRCLKASKFYIDVSVHIMNEYALVSLPELSSVFGVTDRTTGCVCGQETGFAWPYEALEEKEPLSPNILTELKRRCSLIDTTEIRIALSSNLRYERRFDDIDCTVVVDLRR